MKKQIETVGQTMIDPEKVKYYQDGERWKTTKKINDKYWFRSHLVYAFNHGLTLEDMQLLLNQNYCIRCRNRDESDVDINNLELIRRQPPSRFINEIGNKYGKIVVIKKVKNSGTKAKWQYKCECGNTGMATGTDLRGKKVLSCGCSHIKNEIGNRYSQLTVIEYDKKRSQAQYHGAYWLCKCDCGKTISVNGNSLRQGATKSCGHERNLLSGESSLRSILRGYKLGALRRGLIFKLSNEEFKNLTSQNCHYCGDPPYNEKYESKYEENFIYNGIDRVNPLKGYTVENCVPCCRRCNWAKHKSSYADYMSWLDRITKRRFLK